VTRAQGGSGSSKGSLKALGLAAGAALALQIFLGGWTSANYAAVACPDFPTCQTQWWPGIADFGAGFDLLHEIGPNYEGGVLDHPARVAIHFVHRLGALLATLLIAAFAAGVWRRVEVRPAGAAMLAALAAQIAIGISIVLLGGPKSVLPLAVAHNGVAALLLLTVLHANQRIRQPV
jgi:cytochrome c oxidase assembly protein subunit 15